MDYSNIIQSTAGAIPFINEKGDVSMQKVKVQRYITGKRPAYAPDSDEDLSDDEHEIMNEPDDLLGDGIAILDDSVLRRFPDSAEISRKPRVQPEVIYDASENVQDDSKPTVYDSDDNEKDLDEEELTARRELIKQRLKEKQKDTYDVLDYEDELSEKEELFSSEYEEYTDSEEEVGPLRLKPFFVKKEDRVTIQTEEKKEEEAKTIELERICQQEERKKESHQLLEELINLEKQKKEGTDNGEAVINTDDENDEEEYENWKLRELKRIKRDREEREQIEKEKEEIERIHGMNERERKIEFSKNPKHISNKQDKNGQYKFLQKYYHRGAFYLDKEEEVLKKDFSSPTLEDHFDKQVLPTVMQVKRFGRSGRTKYTHLLDQDTTQKDLNPWSYNDSLAIKFQNKGGGMKQTFEKPTAKKQKLNYS